LWQEAYGDALGAIDEWDWEELDRLSPKFRHHIGTRLAVRKQRNGIVRPVLRYAEELTGLGYGLTLN
jgi:hypothetical protein